MKVLSFDVGIKNLAVCLIEWSDSDDIKTNLKIHYWDIINLVQNSNDIKNITNCCINNECKTKPKSFIEFNFIKYCFCLKHLAKKDDLLKNIIEPYLENKWIQTKNLKCSKCNSSESSESLEIKKIKLNSKKIFHVNETIGLTLCAKHYKQFYDKSIKSFSSIHPLKNKKVKDMSVNDIKLQLITNLDQRANIMLPHSDIVLIENQPTLKNPSMKAISDTIYTWFMIRGIVDNIQNNSSIKEVKFISPSNKLKEFNTKLITEADDSKKYKITKKISVDNTKSILSTYGLNKWLNHIQSFDKKDDLADSFLQGWYVLNNVFNNKLHNQLQLLVTNKLNV